MKQVMWFVSGLLMGLTALTFAKGAVRNRGLVTDDTAIYQRLSEIRVPKQGKIDADPEISRLAMLEKRYQEKLPSLKHQKSSLVRKSHVSGARKSSLTGSR